MSMTKKDFIALADVLRDIENRISMFDSAYRTSTADFEQGYRAGTEQARIILRAQLIDFCVARNPRFNRERWLDYIAGKCGANGGSAKQPLPKCYKCGQAIRSSEYYHDSETGESWHGLCPNGGKVRP
jgi:hypothetical protein